MKMVVRRQILRRTRDPFRCRPSILPLHQFSRLEVDDRSRIVTYLPQRPSSTESPPANSPELEPNSVSRLGTTEFTQTDYFPDRFHRSFFLFFISKLSSKAPMISWSLLILPNP
ncbi:hypothetical protein Bca4012_088928 [Brassica carinata]|nr:unnamed protein product [Brassica napus]